MKDTSSFGVLGRNAGRSSIWCNLHHHPYRVPVFDVDREEIGGWAAQERESLLQIEECSSIAQFLSQLPEPRIILCFGLDKEILRSLIKAGLKKGDVLLDCGHGHWRSSVKLSGKYSNHCRFLDCGIAECLGNTRVGPALSVGGESPEFDLLQPILQDIAVKIDPETGRPLSSEERLRNPSSGVSSVALVGSVGAGNYVRRLQQALQGTLVQLLGDAYYGLHECQGLSAQEIADVFAQWNRECFDSFLFEAAISAISHAHPGKQGELLIDSVDDYVFQPCSERSVAQHLFEIGAPATGISEMVLESAITRLQIRREEAAQQLPLMVAERSLSGEEYLSYLRDALYCSMLVAYAQLSHSIEVCGWTKGKQSSPQLIHGEVFRVWRGAHPLNGRILNDICRIEENASNPQNFLCSPIFRKEFKERLPHWRNLVSESVTHGEVLPGIASMLSYYDRFRSGKRATVLVQLLRDRFGHEGFRMIDSPYHNYWVKWTEDGSLRSEGGGPIW